MKDREGGLPRRHFPRARPGIWRVSRSPRADRSRTSKVPAAPLRQSQRLEAIGLVAPSLAHELGSALQGVSNNLEFLGDAFSDLIQSSAADLGELDEEIPEGIRGAGRALDRATGLLTALRDVIVRPTEYIEYDVNRVLQSVLRLAGARLRQVAEVHLDLGPIPRIPWHGEDLSQVFIHLVLNAAHAIELKSPVEEERRPGHFHIWTECDDREIRIGFRDDGCGMPEHVQARIFEPFFTTKPPEIGTGQGLALAHSVVESGGGHMTVESEEGRGTCVVLHLPRPSSRAE